MDQFIGDMGITGEAFVMACEMASQKLHKSIINQLLAVENFILFKKMMISRNKQLNEEAMKELNKQGKFDEKAEEKAAKEREKAESEQKKLEE